MDPILLQVSILSKICTHFLHLDLSDILSISSIPTESNISVQILPPSDTSAMYKAVISSGLSKEETPSLPPLAPEPKKTGRKMPPKKKFTKLPTNYKSSVESEDEERRIHRKLATAISNNNIYSDFERYCSNFISTPDMLQSKDERIKSIPMIGFGVYMSTLKTMSNADKVVSRDKYTDWEIRMLNRMESMKYVVMSDDLDIIRQGQNIYYQNSMNKLPVLSIDQAIQCIKSPLLAYMSIKEVLDGLFCHISNFMGYVEISGKTKIYRLTSVYKGVKKWEFVDEWHDFVINMSNQLIQYMVSMFRNIYFVHFQDNTYREREAFGHIPELNILFENIRTVTNYSVLDQILIGVITANRHIPPTDNNKFDFYGKDTVLERIQDSGSEIKQMVSRQMFDEIPVDVYVF